VVNEAGPVRDVAIVGGDRLIVVHAVTGALSWIDAGSGAGSFSLPEGDFSTIAGHGPSDPWACALATGTGELACFGDHPLVSSAPSEGGFTGVTVGATVACATRPDELPTCWRANTECPDIISPRGPLTDLTTDGCYVCGVDPLGFGECWPRRWTRESAAQ